MSDTLTHVILSNPSLIDAAPFQADAKFKRSWIQLAKTGSFVSNRYGKFSITRDDLTQMLHNFNEVTPLAPTELPIDFDHLSMDPKKPGDGIAAGWMKQLALRENGEELWAEVEWTPDGSQRIANQEYRFISPSFVKDHTHKDGKKIGTTLLAAAITNHPFLEGMRALTLYNFSAHGDLALSGGNTAFELAEVGQRVMIAPGNARTQDEIGGTYEIAEVVGEGDDAFVSVKDAAGMVHKWFRMTEVLPASTVPANPAHPGLQPGQMPVIPSQLPTVPVQPVTQSMNPKAAETAAAAAAQAAPAIDPKTGEPTVAPDALPAESKEAASEAAQAAKKDPAAAAFGAKVGTIAPTGGKAANPFAKKGANGDAPAAGVKAGVKAQPKENKGATGAQAGEAGPLLEELDNVEMSEALKKAIAALLAGGQLPSLPLQKGIAHMMFKLRNDKNEEIQVTTEQLAAAGIQVVPEGATTIPTTELAEMKGTITNLSSTVDVLKADNDAKAKDARALELRSTLGMKLKGGFISKVTHDALFAQFKDAVDLTAFKSLIATFTNPIIALNTEHGSGGDVRDDRGDASTEKIIALSNQLAKERGISLSDAVKLAGAQLASDADAYREQFANAVS